MSVSVSVQLMSFPPIVSHTVFVSVQLMSGLAPLLGKPVLIKYFAPLFPSIGSDAMFHVRKVGCYDHYVHTCICIYTCTMYMYNMYSRKLERIIIGSQIAR